MGKYKEMQIVAQDEHDGRIAMNIADMHQSAVAVMYDVDEVWERQEARKWGKSKGDQSE